MPEELLVCAPAAKAADSIPAEKSAAIRLLQMWPFVVLDLISVSWVWLKCVVLRTGRWWRSLRSARGCSEQPAHAHDFGALVGVDVRGVLKDLRLLRCAIGRKEIAHHDQRSFVVADHVLEE